MAGYPPFLNGWDGRRLFGLQRRFFKYLLNRMPVGVVEFDAEKPRHSRANIYEPGAVEDDAFLDAPAGSDEARLKARLGGQVAVVALESCRAEEIAGRRPGEHNAKLS